MSLFIDLVMQIKGNQFAEYQQQLSQTCLPQKTFLQNYKWN